MGVGFSDAVPGSTLELPALGRGVAGRFSIARFGKAHLRGRIGRGGDGEDVLEEEYRCVDAGDCGPSGCHI